MYYYFRLQTYKFRENIFSRMEVNLDLYIRNLRIFYQQLIKEHKKQKQLTAGFKALIENQIRKWNKTFLLKREAAQARGQGRMLSRNKEPRLAKLKLGVDAVYASEKIEDIVAFGYCYLMLEYKNAKAFTFLSEGLLKIIQKKTVFNEIIGRRIKYFWDKISQVVTERRKLTKLQRLLQDGFKDLPPNLLQVLYQIILQGKQLKNMNIPQYLEQLAVFLSIRIDFFSISQDDSIKFYTFGKDFNIAMRFGYFKKQKYYGYVTKLPQKESGQLNSQTLFENFASISDNLNRMYSTSLKQYMTLTNLITENKLQRANSIVSTNTTNQLQTYTQQNQSQYQQI